MLMFSILFNRFPSGNSGWKLTRIKVETYKTKFRIETIPLLQAVENFEMLPGAFQNCLWADFLFMLPEAFEN
jgi:hypothetical protein